MQYDPNSRQPSILAAAGAAGALARPARAKGPLVWLDMDQQELDDAYDQIVYAPNRDQVGKRRIANSEKTRAVLLNSCCGIWAVRVIIPPGPTIVSSPESIAA